MTRLAAWVATLGAAHLFAADPPKLSVKSESVDPPKELALRELLDARATTVSDARGTVCSLWLAKAIPLTNTKVEPTYRSVTPGTLIGAVRFARAWIDFRTQEIAAGVYTLRLALQPVSKDHEGTTPYRDFCILVPAAEDKKPGVLPLKTLIAMSGKATGGTHPVVMLLVPHPKPAAEPVILHNDKRAVVGVRANARLGFGLTVIGVWTD